MCRISAGCVTAAAAAPPHRACSLSASVGYWFEVARSHRDDGLSLAEGLNKEDAGLTVLDDDTLRAGREFADLTRELDSVENSELRCL